MTEEKNQQKTEKTEDQAAIVKPNDDNDIKTKEEQKPETEERSSVQNDFEDDKFLSDDIDGLSREDWILARIRDEDLMEYLRMEEKKRISEQETKERREKRIFSLVELGISLAAIVAIVGFLKDNPVVLVNILYILAIITGLWIWKFRKPGE